MEQHRTFRSEAGAEPGMESGTSAGDVDGQPVSGLDASGGWREMAGVAKSWLLCISCTLEVYPFQVQVGRVNVPVSMKHAVMRNESLDR